jgi:hypothetical protein
MAREKRKTPKGQFLKGHYETSYWSYILKSRSGTSLVDALQTFSASLVPYRDFFTEIRSTGGTCEFFIGWFSGANSGEVFDYQLLNTLAYLQIDLSFDIYASR